MDKTEKMLSYGNRFFILIPVTSKMLDEASRVEKISYSKALRDGALTIDEVTKIAKERNLITDADNLEYTTNLIKLGGLQAQLENKDLKEEECVNIAKDIEGTRDKILKHNMKFLEIVENTAERIARNDSDMFLAVSVIRDKDRKSVYKNVDEFREAYDKGEINELFDDALYFVKGIDKDYRNEFPEYKRMKDFGYEMVDDKWTKKVEVKPEVKVEAKP